MIQAIQRLVKRLKEEPNRMFFGEETDEYAIYLHRFDDKRIQLDVTLKSENGRKIGDDFGKEA